MSPFVNDRRLRRCGEAEQRLGDAVAARAEQAVVSEQAVVARAAAEPVGAGVAVEQVVLPVAEERVGAGLAVDQVVAGLAVEEVGGAAVPGADDRRVLAGDAGLVAM